MVDIGHKPEQHRIAIAEGMIRMDAATLKMVRENEIMKGDVITVAEIAGVQAAKRTAELIPLCHPLLLTKITVSGEIAGNGIIMRSEIHCKGQTGVEMEALTAVGISLLTIYDMCKAVDKGMEIRDIKLKSKTKNDLA